MQFKTEIEIGDEPIEVSVGYEYEPADGDGWNEPHYPESVTIYSVKDSTGAEVACTKGHEAFLIDEILDNLHREAAEYAADKAEYRYEEWRDRGMT